MPDQFVNRQKVESPLENWPGHIVVPKELTPEQFHAFWTAHKRHEREDPDDHETHFRFKEWESRRHLVLEWHIDGLKPHHISDDPLDLPSMLIIDFLVASTQDLIARAISLPNLRPPSNGESSSTAQTD